MLINYKNEILHDSSMYRFREPAEAVKAGETVTIRLRTRLNQIGGVYLSLFCEGFRQDYPMDRSGEYFNVSFAAPAEPNVYWYYFNINIGGKTSYYGAQGGRTSGLGCVYSEPPPAFQMTVYAADFDTPDWFKKSVMYQIFPDRFKRSDTETVQKGLDDHRVKGRCVYYHEDWQEPPLYRPGPDGKAYNPCDYYGGTLKGIAASLPYLKTLGIRVLYLNPVFEAASNHRYNTADYRRVDPVLGDDADLKSLCDSAARIGIRVLLDGVFSHTGSDSRYFNRERAYEDVGAYNSPQSPYYAWYTFENYPDKYKCWWGFDTLPEVNEHNPDWQQFIITGEDSVIRHWMKMGVKGYRLDVADELPDDILAMMYDAVKQTDRDGVMLGEVWEDATTKYSYGVKRRYALGHVLDSVTNYPFRDAVIRFLTGKMDAAELKNFLVEQAVNYPKPMYYALMNLLSSHDVERIRTALSVRIDVHELTRDQQASFYISDSQNRKGAALQRLAVLLQFCMPGVPCVYYGDEKGMNGFLDPFNRAPFAQAAYDLTDFYQRMAAIRNAADALSVGKTVFFAPDADCIGILRYITGGQDAFGHTAADGIYFAAVNRSDGYRRVVFDFAGSHPLVSEQDRHSLGKMNGTARCLLTEEPFVLNDALLEVALKPYGAILLKIV